MGKLPETFIEYVQYHERIWGNEHYSKRPSLAAMLESPVVVFWKPLDSENAQQNRFTVTLHDTLDAIEAYYTRLVFRANVDVPTKRIHRIFRDRKRVRIKSVTVDIEFVEED